MYEMRTYGRVFHRIHRHILPCQNIASVQEYSPHYRRWIGPSDSSLSCHRLGRTRRTHRDNLCHRRKAKFYGCSKICSSIEIRCHCSWQSWCSCRSPCSPKKKWYELLYFSPEKCPAASTGVLPKAQLFGKKMYRLVGVFAMMNGLPTAGRSSSVNFVPG